MIYVPCSLEQGMRALTPRQLISRKLNLGQFKGPIQYMAWREMQSTLSPGTSEEDLLVPRALIYVSSVSPPLEPLESVLGGRLEFRQKEAS
jgi:hypothetical protein